jgi:hypothetical protein
LLQKFFVEISTNATVYEIMAGVQGYLTEVMLYSYPNTFLDLRLEQVIEDRRKLSTLSLELTGTVYFLSTTVPESVAQTQQAALQDTQVLNDYFHYNLSVEEEVMVESVLMLVVQAPSIAPSTGPSSMSGMPSTDSSSSNPTREPLAQTLNPSNLFSVTEDNQLGLSTQDQVTKSPSSGDGNRVFVIAWVVLMAVIVIGSILIGLLALRYHRGETSDHFAKLKKQWSTASTALTGSMSSFHRSSSFLSFSDYQGTRSSTASNDENGCDTTPRGPSSTSLSNCFYLESENDTGESEECPDLGMSFDSFSDSELMLGNLVQKQVEVNAPPGLLGLLLGTNAHNELVAQGIQPSSPLLENPVKPGDQLISIDDIDVTTMPPTEVAQLIASKKDQPIRKLLFLRFVPADVQDTLVLP